MTTADSIWATLESRGFTHISSFFADSDLHVLINDFESVHTDTNTNYQIKFVSDDVLASFMDKLAPVVAAITHKTRINVDLTICGVYFDTDKITFSYHQDHEDHYLFQGLYDYLNFYIPIIKPNPEKSNLSIVPFDFLQTRDPKTFERLRGRGASRLRLLKAGRTKVFDDVRGDSWLMNCCVDEIAITPTLCAGDLLVMRGDVIHRTQDADTRRVAVSLRMANSNQIVRKCDLLKGSLVKFRYMIGCRNQFIRALRCFQTMEETTIGELYSHLRATSDPITISGFLLALLQQKLRLQLLKQNL